MNLLQPRTTWGQTVITPSITLQERYDSNVAFGTFAAGRTGSLSDFVTIISPRVALDQQSQSWRGTLYTGLTNEIYARNPGLNYVGVNAGTVLVFDRLVSRLFRGATLQVQDNFVYTPQLPTFLAPGVVPDPNVSSDEAALIPAQGDFARGIQAARANTVSNYGSVTGGYAITTSLRLIGSYSHAYITFGNPIGAQGPGQAQLLSSTTHTYMGGVAYRPSAADSLTATYQYSTSEFQGQGSFATHGISGNYTRILTPGLNGSIYGTYLKVAPPFESTQYTGGANLSYSSRSGIDTLTARYSRQVVASIVQSPVPLISDNVGAGWTHKVTPKLNFALNVNYADNRPAGEVPTALSAGLKFRSYEGTAALNYQISRNYYVYGSFYFGRFEQDFLGSTFSFERQSITVGLTANWPQKVN